jgi:hypothetical protein
MKFLSCVLVSLFLAPLASADWVWVMSSSGKGRYVWVEVQKPVQVIIPEAPKPNILPLGRPTYEPPNTDWKLDELLTELKKLNEPKPVPQIAPAPAPMKTNTLKVAEPEKAKEPVKVVVEVKVEEPPVAAPARHSSVIYGISGKPIGVYRPGMSKEEWDELDRAEKEDEQKFRQSLSPENRKMYDDLAAKRTPTK